MVTWQQWMSNVAGRLSRRARVALFVSVGLHVSAVAVLALVEIARAPSAERPSVAATIIEPIADVAPLEQVSVAIEPAAADADGGSSFNTPDIAIVTGGAPGPGTLSPFMEFGAGDGVPAVPGPALNDTVTPLGGGDGGGSRGSGEGQGIGHGSGDGTGTSFFGLASRGRRFVFVVDASSSMRRPSHGPERTLFNRVKLEIMQSIRQMSEEQEFFIVFFNDTSYPMPATSLVRATQDAQVRYLQWMAEMKSGGQTAPDGAIQLALQLQPDVIYFLSDGEFKYGLVKRVAAMNRGRVVINTVCFGGVEDKNVSLRQIAEQNGGTYHYVPLPAETHETATTSTTKAAKAP